MKSAVICDGRPLNQKHMCGTGNKNWVLGFFQWC